MNFNRRKKSLDDTVLNKTSLQRPKLTSRAATNADQKVIIQGHRIEISGTDEASVKVTPVRLTL